MANSLITVRPAATLSSGGNFWTVAGGGTLPGSVSDNSDSTYDIGPPYDTKVYTLRPNGASAADSNITLVGGSSSWAILADNNVSSWNQFFSGTSPGTHSTLTDLPALATGEYIYQVGVRVNWESSGAGGQNFQVALEVGGFVAVLAVWNFHQQNFTITSTGGLGNQPNLSPWTPTAVNAMNLHLTDNNAGPTLPQVAEAYVDVYTAIPTNLDFQAGGFIMPANSQVKSIQPRIRVLQNTGAAYNYRVQVKNATTPSDVWNTWTQSVPNGGSITTYNGPVLAAKDTGPLFTQADINNLGVSIFAAGSDVRLHEVYLDIQYNSPSVVTVTAPTGTVTASSTPAITWTNADPEGDAQERWQVKIFTAAQYGATGFDPEVATAYWDSGVVFSSAVSTLPGIPLTNSTTFRAYVKTGSVGSSGGWSLWYNSQFSTSYTVPGTPTAMTVTNNNSGAYYTIQLTSTAGSVTTDYFEVQRSNDGGFTWAYVRGGDHINNPTPGTAVAIQDYECIPNAFHMYRMRASHIVSPGIVTVTAWNNVTPPTFITNTTWQLKDPLNPSNNMQIVVIPPFEFSRREPMGLYDALGRATSIWVSDGMKSIQGTIKIRLRTQSDHDGMWAIAGSGHTLLLQDWSYSRQWYIKLGDSGDYATVMSAPSPGAFLPVRTLSEVTYTFREVAAP